MTDLMIVFLINGDVNHITIERKTMRSVLPYVALPTFEVNLII